MFGKGFISTLEGLAHGLGILMGFLQTGLQVNGVFLSLLDKGVQHLLIDRSHIEPSQVGDIVYLGGINLVMIEGENGLLVILEGPRNISGQHNHQVNFSLLELVQGCLLVGGDPGLGANCCWISAVVIGLLSGLTKRVRNVRAWER